MFLGRVSFNELTNSQEQGTAYDNKHYGQHPRQHIVLTKCQPKWAAGVTSWSPAIGQKISGTSFKETLTNGPGTLAAQLVGIYEADMLPWVLSVGVASAV